MGVTRLVVAFAAMVALAGAALAQSAVDLGGVWRIVREEQSADRWLEVTLTQTDGRLTGAGEHEPCPVCRGYNVYPVTVEGHVMEGRDISLVVAEPRPGGSTLRFHGELSADGATIRGRLHDGYEVNNVVLERVPARAAP